MTAAWIAIALLTPFWWGLGLFILAWFGDVSPPVRARVSRLFAKHMVTEFGMSDKLGSVRYARQRLQYLGAAVAEGSDASAATHETIDAEVRRIVGEQSERAATLVATHRDALSQLSAELLKAESLDGGAVREALSSAAHAAV